MPIDFDDVMAADDNEGRDPRVATVLGLVTSAKAPNGNALLAETECFLRTANLPDVIFIEEDEATGAEVFMNARAFADAMGQTNLPTEAEAWAWWHERAGDVFDAYRDRLAVAFLEEE